MLLIQVKVIVFTGQLQKGGGGLKGFVFLDYKRNK